MTNETNPTADDIRVAATDHQNAADERMTNEQNRPDDPAVRRRGLPIGYNNEQADYEPTANDYITNIRPGYRAGYAAGFPGGITGVPIRPGIEPANSPELPPIDLTTPEGRYRAAYQDGYQDGHQDGEKFAAYNLRIARTDPPSVADDSPDG